MNRVELKQWAREKVKGKRWPLFGIILLVAIIE